MVERSLYSASGFEQIFDKACLDLEETFVFSNVATLMAGGQHAPYRCRQAEGMRQALEYEIAVVGTKAMPTQCSERKGMRRVIGEVKTALVRQALPNRIVQPEIARLQQARNFSRGVRLLFQLARADQIFQLL